MKTIGLSFDDLYFIIDPFDFSRVIRKIAMVYNTVAMPIQHIGEFD